VASELGLSAGLDRPALHLDQTHDQAYSAWIPTLTWLGASAAQGDEWTCFQSCPAPSINTKANAMNKDQVKGEIKEVAGKLQEKAGQVTGSTDQQIKGLAKQGEGRAQKAVGDVKEAIKETAKDVTWPRSNNGPQA
jgi:uncharacterized protein YjbJ (UPF0337 family)